MEVLINALNYDFNYQVALLNYALGNLKQHDKLIALSWANKLKTCGASVQEARLRNDFLYYLVKNCELGELRPPFAEKPPNGQLLNLLHLLPAQKAGHKPTMHEPERRPEIFDRSPDKGAFLVSQPVPRCGAFCYLAIVSHQPDRQD